jgi:cytochrome c biogenesis protein CcmG, thiol:disulfide interchange protein DsbE
VNWKVLAVGAALVVPLVVLLAQGFGKDPHALPDVMTGKAAPPFALVTLDGLPVSLDAARGKPVVLNFWATWCGPCVGEHPELMQAAAQFGPRGVVFLGVLYGDDPLKAQAWLDAKGSAYPTLMDPDQRVAIDYGVAGVPETFIVGPDGMLLHKIVGPVTASQLGQALEPLL